MADENHGLDLSSDENKRKSRKGSIPRNVDTYLKSAMLEGFADEIMKLSEGEPSPAAMKAKHMGQLALFGGLANPALQALGTFTEHSVPGGLGAGIKAVKGLSRGSLASSALTGAVGGSMIAAAKDKLKQHQENELGKIADLLGGMGAPSGPKVSTPAAPTLGVLRGSSNKSQRVGNTPIAAKSGVTRSSSGQAMNPRANLSDAMRPKV